MVAEVCDEPSRGREDAAAAAGDLAGEAIMVSRAPEDPGTA